MRLKSLIRKEKQLKTEKKFKRKLELFWIGRNIAFTVEKKKNKRNENMKRKNKSDREEEEK